MGVTVRSQSIGGKVIIADWFALKFWLKYIMMKTIAILPYLFVQVLVCAHRYIIKEEQSQFGQGLCYLLTKNLEFEEQVNPCSGRSTVR